ncbi:pentatricopeptide repeat-containing protein At5g15010, mitochondrial [Aristolochia californica]|uniref:pentatricopeptide repeat-containing protein At5g15010, mitochondrial n=1 Tax=Aristolochia californica TaxID=171875 RepID=UPI0035DB1168
MWNFRRRSSLVFLSSLLKAHRDLSTTHSQSVALLHVAGYRCLGSEKPRVPSVACVSNPCFSFVDLGCRFSTTAGVEENGSDGEADDVNDDDDNEFRLAKSSRKDGTLIHSVESIMNILDDFGRDAAEAKRKLDKCDVPASPELVEEVLSRVRNDWSAAFTFFLWAQKQAGYAHSTREYHTMIAILGKMKKFDTAWSLVNEMRRVPGTPLLTPQTLLILIRKYCAVHDVAKAIGTFYSFKRYGFTLGVEEFQDLLSALCRYKNVQDAEHLLFCNENSFPFDTKSFNIVLNGWCNMIVNLRVAKRFWNDMARRGIARDVVSYGSMISCYSKAGSLRDVLRLLDEMKRVGISPDRKGYNAVVYALAKGKCVKEAINLVKTMEGNGCIPNVVTYNSLIKPLCKARKLEHARFLLNEMLQRGLSPSIRTYHTFLAIVRTPEEAFELINKMKETGCAFAHDTYIMLIRKFCRWQQHENVFKIWNEMQKNGLSPDRSSYIVLIHGLFLNGKLNEAFNYYEEMKEKGFPPEPKTDEMLQAWLYAKESSRAQMTELHTKKDSIGPLSRNNQGSLNSDRRNFLKPELRKVTRERGFSFW